MSDNTEALVIDLGHGDWIVCHGVLVGAPFIQFAPAPERGAPGANADGLIPTDSLAPRAVVLRFATKDSCFAHIERVKAMIENFEKAVNEFLPDPAP